MPLRVVLVTLDGHLAGSVDRARATLARELPGLTLTLHPATEWGSDPDALARCTAAVADGDIIVVTMLFMEEHIRALLPALAARRERCDALVCAMSAGEVIRLTKMGSFTMDGGQRGPLALLKKLRGARKHGGGSSGEKQLALLRRLPKILRFIPGTAQDLRAYFLTLQYRLASSEDNVVNMVRLLVDRYADGPRRALRGALPAAPPVDYPDVGVYHPRLKRRIGTDATKLPAPKKPPRGTVGLLVMRAYVLAGNCRHYDAVIDALEAQGLRVVPAFASGLDARPAVDAYFRRDGRACVDAVVSLTGFSLIGGPAYNDAAAAAGLLGELDVPYLAAHAIEFQTLDQWRGDRRGLMPVETTMMVAIPELDGATGPLLYGGRGGDADKPPGTAGACDMRAHPERAAMLAARVARLVALRRSERAERRLAIVLFNFPPNAGATGSAAHLAVFESLYNTLASLRDGGYEVELPADVDALRERLLGGNAAAYGCDANVVDKIAADDHVRHEPHLGEIEAQWGPAPGRQLSDGASIFILGERFGKVLVAVQPGFGYEGDPMRLLFETGFAPTHAFSAFYRYLREDFAAHAVLHFGTHGALEFMPGKQSGLSADCWPDRLIGDLPNYYLYASNNPSEGTIAKRRAAATLISYLTPPLAQAGLYRGLSELKSSLERWRGLAPDAGDERRALAELVYTQARELDLLASVDAGAAGGAAAEDDDGAAGWAAAEPTLLERRVAALNDALLELEYALIPHGLHVVGAPPSASARAAMLAAVADAGLDDAARLAELEGLLAEDHELPALLRALDGRFVAPAPGGDLLRTPEVLPTGRNLHGFDPFRIPSAYALRDGARQAERLLARHAADGHPYPESLALVLWGTDNLKTEGGPIAQALALIGARPRFDGYGRLSGAELVPLAELGRPRVDVMITLSGIFRDLLPLQTRLLAEATYLAAAADEPETLNFIRKHARVYQQRHGCDLETAALRVFGNADGAYGANVNQLIDAGCWDDEGELADAYTKRKGFAYGRSGAAVKHAALLDSVLGDVELAYQNLDSVELGVTTIDHYFDTLGGVSRAVRRVRGGDTKVYIGDQTQGDGKVRTLAEQVALETRTRTLNPKWYEGMLAHGYEGVRQIEAHVTNTVGWSATTGQVAPWVYQQLSQTFVLDDAMRNRLAGLNPGASARVANRLLEAHERNYWSPDEATLEALRRAGEELEDRLEGIVEEAAA